MFSTPLYFNTCYMLEVHVLYPLYFNTCYMFEVHVLYPSVDFNTCYMLEVHVLFPSVDFNTCYMLEVHVLYPSVDSRLLDPNQTLLLASQTDGLLPSSVTMSIESLSLVISQM